MRAAFIAPALLLLSPLAVADDTKPAGTQAIYDCASLEDDQARLSCYDDAVGRLKAAEDAGEVTTISKAEVETIERESFGFSMPSLPKIVMPKFGGDSDELKRVEEAIASVSKGRNGGLRVTLQNGQVWEQTDSKPVRVSRKKPPQTATIKKAAFGSFMMKLDKGVLFRAERVK